MGCLYRQDIDPGIHAFERQHCSIHRSDFPSAYIVQSHSLSFLTNDSISILYPIGYLYFFHNAENLVEAGQAVCSGEALARMGNTGNAALADPPFAHCHLEARATATGRGLNPAAYAGLPNAVGIYTQAPGPAAMQRLTMENLPNADAWEIFTLCEARGLVAAGLYSARYLDAAATRQTVTVGPVSEGDAQAIFRLACARGLNDGRYKAAWVQGEE